MFIKAFEGNSRLLKYFFVFVFTFLFGRIQAQPDGEKLFKDNCTQCHAVRGVVIGPELAGISQRKDEAWLIKWIKNSQAVIKSGDAYAVDLFNKYNKTVMPNQAVNDEEIKAILAYIAAEEKKAPVQKGPVATEPGAPAEDKGVSGWTLFFIILILAALAVALGRVKKGLEYAIREKEGMPHPVPVEGKQAIKNWIRGNKKLIAVILLIGFCVGSWKGWYALAAIGISKDYQPEQPIKFSHKLHAGDNKINCQYCHTGVETSRHANIPSVGTCMNCHKFIKEGPLYGDAEIKKIYAALDWDGVNYGKNQKPVQWIRVHNLPDLAYFNHAQHIKVGKLECKQCHGDVETMEEVKQVQPLTMGWCIDCHRTTEVKMEGNHYYDDYHKKLESKYGKDAKLTVDKIGGIECLRCHY